MKQCKRQIGKKDKTGKEICIGDIVEFVYYYYDEHKPYKIRDVVTLERKGYWLENESFGWEGEDLINPEETKVIGNVKDDPELLKKMEE